eukprot:2358087-Prorocentrum_lima.AAC.1
MAPQMDSSQPHARPHSSTQPGAPTTARILAPPPPSCCNSTITAPSSTFLLERKETPRIASLPTTVQTPQSSPAVARN